MNCRAIQRAIMIDRYRRSLVCPNYTPRKWWECDVFELTDAGYFREYEIKLSLSDFKADAKKSWRSFNYESGQDVSKKKHLQLGLADPNGPTHFNFVAPAGLIPLELIPSWAGLIEATQISEQDTRVRLAEVKKAPRLHSQKMGPKVADHVRGVFYYRFQHWFLFNRLDIESQESPPEIGEGLSPLSERTHGSPESGQLFEGATTSIAGSVECRCGEMADARDLKSCDPEGHVGSNPATDTKFPPPATVASNSTKEGSSK